MKKTLLALLIVCVGCSSTKYNYEVHLKEGDGTMHLYNGQDYADAISYIREYEKSHGDMVLIKTEK